MTLIQLYFLLSYNSLNPACLTDILHIIHNLIDFSESDAEIHDHNHFINTQSTQRRWRKGGQVRGKEMIWTSHNHR